MYTARVQAIGDPVPTLTLTSIATGEPTFLDACLAGRRGGVVVFWSGVCTHCVRYDPYFNQFETAHPELALYVVATRFTESVDDVRRAIVERGLRFPLYNGADGTAAAAYLAQQTPRVYLVDPARTLMYRGAVDNFKYAADPEYQPYLERAIESFLAGKAIERPETGSFGCAVKSVYYQLPKMIERPPARG